MKKLIYFCVGLTTAGLLLTVFKAESTTVIRAYDTTGIPGDVGAGVTLDSSLNWTFSGNAQINGQLSSGSTGQFTVTSAGVGAIISLNIAATNGLVIGASGNTPTGTLVATNFISGQLYTNLTGRPIFVNASAVLTASAVSGNCTMQLRVTGTGASTNATGLATTALSIAMNYTNIISGFIPPLGTYTFTNVSAGAGDSAAMLSGSGQYIVY